MGNPGSTDANLRVGMDTTNLNRGTEQAIKKLADLDRKTDATQKRIDNLTKSLEKAQGALSKLGSAGGKFDPLQRTRFGKFPTDPDDAAFRRHSQTRMMAPFSQIQPTPPPTERIGSRPLARDARGRFVSTPQPTGPILGPMPETHMQRQMREAEERRLARRQVSAANQMDREFGWSVRRQEREEEKRERQEIRAENRRRRAEEERERKVRIQVNEADRARIREERDVQRQVNIADAFRTREGNAQTRISDRFRSQNFDEINREIRRREGRGSPNLMQFGAAGGRGGGISGIGRRLLGGGGGGLLGGFVGGLASGFGIGLGGMAVARGIEGIVAATQQATAYERQSIAAEKLAGSQGKLNQLLDAYTKASGGAVSKSTTLASVTRLLATGFAETVPEMEKFVRATRGASIALGKPQDEVTQETQLAISNTSVKRLDQIGLGIEEVQVRVEELRNANAGLNRELAFQQAVLGLLDEKYGDLAKSIEGQATGVEKLAKAWDDLILAMGGASKGAVGGLFAGLATLLTQMTKTLEKQEELGRRAAIQTQSGGIMGGGYGPFSNPVSLSESQIDFVLGSSGRDAARHGRTGASTPFTRPENQQELIDQAYDSLEQIERQAAEARLQEVENYERQREDIIVSYGKSIVREEEDFVRQRARSLRDYEQAIVDVMKDAQDRESDMREDHADRIADAREDSDERLADMQENYNEDRERAEKEHRDALMKAAGQLNAIEVLEERKQFKRQMEDQRKQHEKSIENEKESLQEKIEDADEALQEQLEDAREADAERLEDMRVNRERQLKDEDEDRAIRLQRQAEDHQDQLDELDRQHALRLEQIAEQAAKETDAIEEALAKDLAALGYYIAGYQEKMKERDELIEKWFDKVIERLEDDIKFGNNAEKKYNPDVAPERIPSYASGGPVGRTGPAMLHAGEYVLSSRMVSSGYSPGGNSYNNRSAVVQAGAIVINTLPGQEYLVGDILEQRLIEILERI